MDDARVRAALGYPKFRHDPRVLIFDTQYLLVDDVVDAALDCGWQVLRLPARKTGTADGELISVLLKTLLTFRPDFVLTVNHLGFDRNGVLSGLLERYQIPIASWFVDHPMPILAGAEKNAVPNVQIFSFERETLNWLSQNGYGDPVHLPTGSNERFFHQNKVPVDLVGRYACDISFVGNSWWYKARVEPTKAVRRMAQTIGGDRKWDRRNGNSLLEKYLRNGKREHGLAAQVAMAEASMASRQRLISQFKSQPITLVGDSYWERLCPWGAVSPYLDYHNELPAFYAASKINLNITSEQMPTAVNQRVWDVPGVGGFLLTDSQSDVLDHFEDGVNVAIYASVDEALSKARYYLGKPQLRERISQKGLEAVNSAHRMTHRVAKMYDVMKARFG